MPSTKSSVAAHMGHGNGGKTPAMYAGGRVALSCVGRDVSLRPIDAICRIKSTPAPADAKGGQWSVRLMLAELRSEPEWHDLKHGTLWNTAANA